MRFGNEHQGDDDDWRDEDYWKYEMHDAPAKIGDHRITLYRAGDDAYHEFEVMQHPWHMSSSSTYGFGTHFMSRRLAPPPQRNKQGDTLCELPRDGLNWIHAVFSSLKVER